MIHLISAITLASLVTTDDPSYAAWSAVQRCRDVKRTTGRASTAARTQCERPCVDALPSDVFTSRTLTVRDDLAREFAAARARTTARDMLRKIGGAR